MAWVEGRSSRALLPQLGRLFQQGSLTGFSEERLLDEYIARRDETAFEAIVIRHGPMVLGVCRQILRDPNDIEDAFQATFVVLARRASSVQRQELLGNWLYGVAYKVASRARSQAIRRQSHQKNLTPTDELGARSDEPEGLDPDTVLRVHDEVGKLPDKYRLPIVLCYLEGLTHEDAAKRLGWPLGSVKGRLSRARDLLKSRLVRQGVGLSLVALTSVLDRSVRGDTVPAFLRLRTVQTALTMGSSTVQTATATSMISISVSFLVEGVLRAMAVTHVRNVLLLAAVGIGVLATGTTIVAYQLGGLELLLAESGQQKPSRGAAQVSPPNNQRALPADSVPPQIPGPNGMGMGGMGRGRAANMAGGMMGGGKAPGEEAADALAEQAAKQENTAIELQAVGILANALQKQDKNPKTAHLLKKLEETVTMQFPNETPLDDILKYIQATTSDNKSAIFPIYVDPIGLTEMERTSKSTVTIALEGVPLKTTLRLVLNQLGLAYCIHDGFMMISSPRGVREELEQACMELGIESAVPLDLKERLDSSSFGIMGGTGGSGMM